MKKCFAFSICLLLTLEYASGYTPMSFLDAINNNNIKVNTIETNGLGHHNIVINVQNLTSEPLDIVFGPGLLFSPKDDHFQKLLHTDSVMLAIKAKSWSTTKLSAYCTQPQNMGPRTPANYRGFSQADEDLTGLARLIFDNKLDNVQQLVWAFVGKSDSYNFSAYSPQVQKAIHVFFDTWAPKAKLRFTSEEVVIPPYIVSIAANFAFMNENEQNLTFKIFTMDGQLVKTIFENSLYKSGAHIIKFGFNGFYPQGTQFVAKLLTSNDEVYQEMVVDEFTPYQEMEIHQLNFTYKFVVKQIITKAKITVYGPSGEKITTVKQYEQIAPAYHNLNFSFFHYFDPKSKFTVELSDIEGKLYDKTEFDAYKASRKLFQVWK